MFEYIHLKNFRSFKDITMNLLDKQGNLKKLIVLFGANGSGKTNLISAFAMLANSLRTMQLYAVIQAVLAGGTGCLSGDELNENIKTGYQDMESLIRKNKMPGSEEPMLLEFGFRLAGKSGRYLFETDNTGIIHERLEYTLSKNRGVYFDITPEQIFLNTKVFPDKLIYEELKEEAQKLRGRHLLTSILLNKINNGVEYFPAGSVSENLLQALQFFSGIAVSSDSCNIFTDKKILSDYEHGEIPPDSEYLLNESEDLLNKVLKLISKNTDEAYYFRQADERKINYQLIIRNKADGKSCEIPYYMAPSGIREFLHILPYITAGTSGHTAAIDDFGSKIHDITLNRLIESTYSSLQSAFSGQIFITTHKTSLLEASLPRESIYTLAEDPDGTKKAACITQYDPKIHRDANVRKQYLEGKYLGIPENLSAQPAADGNAASYAIHPTSISS